MSKTVAPYGSWASPISIEEKAASGEAWFGYSVVDLDERGVLWIEQRPAEGGRSALMREGVGEVVPGFDARTRVHEYGADARRVTGGPDEAVFQPEWGPAGRLHWVSDRDGWWNLYRDGEQLTELEAELGTPSWTFSLRSYGFLEDGRIACTVIDQGVHS